MSAVAERAPKVRARGLTPIWACSAVAFLVVSLAIGVLAGPVDLGVGSVLESAGARLHVPGVATSLSPTEEAILWEIRVPRVLLAALVGAMLAVAGATYQGVFRNPLADPYLLGVAGGRVSGRRSRSRISRTACAASGCSRSRRSSADPSPSSSRTRSAARRGASATPPRSCSPASR